MNVGHCRRVLEGVVNTRDIGVYCLLYGFYQLSFPQGYAPFTFPTKFCVQVRANVIIIHFNLSNRFINLKSLKLFQQSYLIKITDLLC